MNHRVPFYRLPDAMAAIPELQTPTKTSWRPSDVLASLRLAVWDTESARMLTYAELTDKTSSRGSCRPHPSASSPCTP
ncbi:MAG TPA: hypothetical protein VGH87_28900, partial [Polyangiaceae bacterium]